MKAGRITVSTRKFEVTDVLKARRDGRADP